MARQEGAHNFANGKELEEKYSRAQSDLKSLRDAALHAEAEGLSGGGGGGGCAAASAVGHSVVSTELGDVAVSYANPRQRVKMPYLAPHTGNFTPVFQRVPGIFLAPSKIPP